jgi:carbonic anhydrase
VKDVAEKYETDISTRPNQDMRLDRLCELNVIEQVLHVCRTTIVLDAWKKGQALTVHGWVYRLQSGMLKEIGVSISSHKDLEIFLAQKTMPGATH